MINNLLKNFWLITFALIAPITLPACGIQKNLKHNNLHNEILNLSHYKSLFTFGYIFALHFSTILNSKINKFSLYSTSLLLNFYRLVSVLVFKRQQLFLCVNFNWPWTWIFKSRLHTFYFRFSFPWLFDTVHGKTYEVTLL